MRAIFSTAKFRLRAGWRSVALIAIVGGLALGVVFTAQSFSGTTAGKPSLTIAPILPVGDVLRWTFEHREANDLQAQGLADLLKLLLGVSWVVLASAVITIISRAAAQAALRRSEFTVRRAVGASRGVLQLAVMVEIGVIVTLIVVAGLLLGLLGTKAGMGSWPGVTSQGSFAPRLAVLLLGFLCVQAVVLLLPPSQANLSNQEEGEVPLALPAAQLGFGLAILIAGSLVLSRATEVTHSGAATGGISGSIVSLDLSKQPADERAARYQDLLDTLAGDDAVKVVSLTNAGGQSGVGPVDLVTTDCGQCPDGGIILKFHSFPGLHEFVSPDTFEAQGMRLVAGRGFTRDDDWNAPRVAVVGRHLAYRHFQGGDAIGRDLFVASGWPAHPYKVIGVVEDTNSTTLGGSVQPLSTVYLSVLQHPPEFTELLVRSSSEGSDSTRLASILATGLGASAPARVVSESERARQEAAPLRWFGFWFGLAGWVLLGIGVVGTFTLLRLWVRSRAFELALRRSVGASRFRIVWFVVRRTIIVGIGGVAIGLFLFATIVRPSMADLFAGLPAWNPTVVIRLSLLLVGVALAGSLVPTIALLKRPPLAATN